MGFNNSIVGRFVPVMVLVFNRNIAFMQCTPIYSILQFIDFQSMSVFCPVLVSALSCQKLAIC